jgi:hypothetical protein
MIRALSQEDNFDEPVRKIRAASEELAPSPHKVGLDFTTHLIQQGSPPECVLHRPRFADAWDEIVFL